MTTYQNTLDSYHRWLQQKPAVISTTCELQQRLKTDYELQCVWKHLHKDCDWIRLLFELHSKPEHSCAWPPPHFRAYRLQFLQKRRFLFDIQEQTPAQLRLTPLALALLDEFYRQYRTAGGGGGDTTHQEEKTPEKGHSQ